MEEDENQIQKNYFVDKIIIENDNIKSNNESSNSDFNLEIQKYKFPPDSQSKFNKEFQKLVEFVKESNLYRDIYGNRITKKGKLLPTPYQKLIKMNEEIRNYYDKKINSKISKLIIKNYSNKILTLDNDDINSNLNNKKAIINFRNYTNKNIKNIKHNNINLKFKKIHFKTNNDFNLKMNIQHDNKNNFNHKKMNKNTLQKIDIKKNISLEKPKNNNSRKIKYFNDTEFNQINFWKTKLLAPLSLNKTNYVDQKLSFSSRNKNFITDYNSKSKENLYSLMHRTININRTKQKFHKYKTFYKSKVLRENLDNDKLFEFNLQPLIKPSLNHKGEIVLNARKIKAFKNDIKNIHKNEEKKNNSRKMENKIISVNMDNALKNQK